MNRIVRVALLIAVIALAFDDAHAAYRKRPRISSERPDNLQAGILAATIALNSPQVSPVSGKSTDTYTFSVVYINSNNVAPSSVTLYLDTGSGFVANAMSMAGTGNPDYAQGVTYRYVASSLPRGTHRWYVKAVVAGEDLYPSGVNQGSPANSPTVNGAPVLANANVNPIFGRPSGSVNPAATDFTFTVVYSDPDGVAPSGSGYVRLRHSGLGGVLTMTAAAGPYNWVTGVQYSVTTKLPSGTGAFYFEASDGIEAVRFPSGTGVFSGPTVSSPPTLTSGTVSPSSGTPSTDFTFRVTYADADNDPPSESGGESSMKVLIDGQPRTMTKLVPSANNYVAGVVYTYTTKLVSGDHVYSFQVSDGIDLVSSDQYSGLNVRPTGITISASSNPIDLGQVVVVSGNILPVKSVGVAVQFLKPSGVTVTKSVTTDATTGQYSASLLVDETGLWNVSVTQALDSSVTAGLSPALTVNALPLRVDGNTIDMISFPVTAASGDPGDIITVDKAKAIRMVIYDPASLTYKQYGVSLTFPDLTATSGFWIYPSITQTLLLNGTLPDQTVPNSIALQKDWNQIGSGYLSSVVWADSKVVCGGVEYTLANAAANGIIRDYAWGRDPAANKYVLVRGTGGDTTTLEPFRGYWVRALLPCTLILAAPDSDLDKPPVVPN